MTIILELEILFKKVKVNKDKLIKKHSFAMVQKRHCLNHILEATSSIEHIVASQIRNSFMPSSIEYITGYCKRYFSFVS